MEEHLIDVSCAYCHHSWRGKLPEGLHIVRCDKCKEDFAIRVLKVVRTATYTIEMDVVDDDINIYY